jgi:hypothetical protein
LNGLAARLEILAKRNWQASLLIQLEKLARINEPTSIKNP